MRSEGGGAFCQNQDFQDWRDFQDFAFGRIALFAIIADPAKPNTGERRRAAARFVRIRIFRISGIYRISLSPGLRLSP